MFLYLYLHITINGSKVVHLPLLTAAALLDRLIVVVVLVIRHMAELGSRPVRPVIRVAGREGAWRRRPKHARVRRRWTEARRVHVHRPRLGKLLAGRKGGVGAGRRLQGRVQVEGVVGPVACSHHFKV